MTAIDKSARGSAEDISATGTDEDIVSRPIYDPASSYAPAKYGPSTFYVASENDINYCTFCCRLQESEASVECPNLKIRSSQILSG